MPGYISKVAKVYVVTITANTWTQVLTAAQAKGIRGYKLKTRYTVGSAPIAFDYAFNSSPDAADSSGDGYWTNSGAGAGDEAGPQKGIWARAAQEAIIELIAYE